MGGVDQLDGTIIAPTGAKAWGKGLFWWIDFTKLKGITVQGTGVIDGRGSVWWQDYPYEDPLDDDSKLIIPLNNSIVNPPPMPVNSQHKRSRDCLIEDYLILYYL